MRRSARSVRERARGATGRRSAQGRAASGGERQRSPLRSRCVTRPDRPLCASAEAHLRAARQQAPHSSLATLPLRRKAGSAAQTERCPRPGSPNSLAPSSSGADEQGDCGGFLLRRRPERARLGVLARASWCFLCDNQRACARDQEAVGREGVGQGQFSASSAQKRTAKHRSGRLAIAFAILAMTMPCHHRPSA